MVSDGQHPLNGGALSGRRALVCGASAGIGRATALALASLGAEVLALARREDRLESLLPELLAAGSPHGRALALDLDDGAAVEALGQQLAEDGPVHILINNTGGPASGPLLMATPEELAAAFNRHVLSAQRLARALVPGMISSGYGRILNVLSTSVREPIPNLGVSNTIRAAMAGWAKSLAQELPPGVTINNLLPGFTDTERLDALAQAGAARAGVEPGQVREAWLKQVPEGRLARAEEPAALLAFLASPAGAYIRGQSIAVDGGRTRSI